MSRARCGSDDVERGIAIASCSVAILSLLPVAAHQLGGLKHLPDPAGDIFDSDKITESKAAHPLGVPDSLPGIASYTVTLALLLTARRSKVARALLGLKLSADASAAGFNVVRQVVTFRKICSWCTATAAATGPMVYFGKKMLKKSR
jgi:uncharacterized membrane protein